MRGHFARRQYVDKTGKKRTASTWSVRYDEPRAEGQPRTQKIKSGFRTRKDAEAWFNRKAEAFRQGVAPHDDRVTVGEYLKGWIETLAAPGSTVRAAALHAYRNYVEKHIIPAMGTVRLSDLHVGHIEAAKAKWSATEQRRRKEKHPLSPRTVRHIYATLNAALNRAKRQRLIAVNPCELTEAPKVERKEQKFLDLPGSEALLRAFEGSPIDAAIVTALGTGLRRGELLALQWRDVDLDGATLTVNRALEHVDGTTRFKDPKTKRSRRTISLPAFVVERLRRHRTEQKERFMADGRPDLAKETDLLVFDRGGGEPWIPNSFGTVFRHILRGAGLPHVRVHDLRHSFASMALEAGVDLKTVSTALGHTTISTTADLYAHVTSSMLKDAADRIDAVLGSALRRVKK
jgi:integrase